MLINLINDSVFNCIVSVSFELPLLTLELKADFGNGEQAFVDLSFNELVVQYDQSQVSETNIQVSFPWVIFIKLIYNNNKCMKSILESGNMSVAGKHGTVCAATAVLFILF